MGLGCILASIAPGAMPRAFIDWAFGPYDKRLALSGATACLPSSAPLCRQTVFPRCTALRYNAANTPLTQSLSPRCDHDRDSLRPARPHGRFQTERQTARRGLQDLRPAGRHRSGPRRKSERARPSSTTSTAGTPRLCGTTSSSPPRTAPRSRRSPWWARRVGKSTWPRSASRSRWPRSSTLTPPKSTRPRPGWAKRNRLGTGISLGFAPNFVRNDSAALSATPSPTPLTLPQASDSLFCLPASRQITRLAALFVESNPLWHMKLR